MLIAYKSVLYPDCFPVAYYRGKILLFDTFTLLASRKSLDLFLIFRAEDLQSSKEVLSCEQAVVSVPTRNKGSRTDEMNRFVFMDFEFECLKKQRQPFGWRCKR